MPRIARKRLNSQIFHIMVQGINKEYIFDTKNNIEKYKKIIIEKAEEHNVNFLSYCVMSNHSHLLTHCENYQDVSKLMQRINTTYSKYYNKINNRVGYVFRDRYKVQEIMDIEQLYNCLRYIHNNPVKANMCNSMSEYKYSSYNEILDIMKGNICKDNQIITPKSIELLFGSKGDFTKTFEMIHNNYDNEDFIDFSDLTVEEYIDEYTKHNNLSINEIKKNKKELEKFIKKTREKTDATLAEIGKVLNKSKTQIGYYANKV